MGSATLSHLARRGVRVLGVDRYSPPHTRGSTHGESRIIREAYYEHPLYVPLVRRAYQCWHDLEQETGAVIYRKTGGLMLGREDGPVVSGSRASALQHAITHQVLTAEQVRRDFPGFAPPDDFVGLWEERAGLLYPEAAVTAYLTQAARFGAVIRTDAPLLQWSADAAGVRVETGQGRVTAQQLVLATGPWLGSHLGLAAPVLQVERQLFHWFQPVSDSRGWPVALWEHHRGGLFATLPDGIGRVKAGVHHEGKIVDPETVERQTTPEEDAGIRALVARYQPGAAGPLMGSAVCLYTNTPDRHFVIDRHRDHPNVLVLSPCSGHGFKFASAIGEVAADLLTGGRPPFDLAPFSLQRFHQTPARP
jgi:sarcosine oxidase